MMRLIVIGGGPAGMAAAVTAKERGVDEVLLLERNSYLGGVLPQCIHNGFGLQLYKKDYTGGEYAWLWKEKTEASGVEIYLNTSVLSVEKGWKVKAISASAGLMVLNADAVIVATGGRERTMPQLMIPGSRPAGIFTAGEAQLMMNLKNYMPGKSAVILGSGDIGLIMARRMTLEGIKVKMVLGKEGTGLARNIAQCVEDFDIPMRYGWTIASTHGYQRLTGVTVAPLDSHGEANLSMKQYIPCDTVLVAAGLIPETEVCNGYKPGKDAGLFICGNADFIHDLVDNVTEDGIITGNLAAEYLGYGSYERPSRLFRVENTGRSGNLICTVCPEGCILQVVKKPFSVTGNRCAKGAEFARQELKNPKRSITSVVRAGNFTVSVKTDGPVDKACISDVMASVKKIHISSPVYPGQIIAENIAGTGVNLVATWYVG